MENKHSRFADDKLTNRGSTTNNRLRKRLSLPNVLFISGTGRNVGKTTLACMLIERIIMETKVIAVKISPHFHKVDYSSALVKRTGKYAVYVEDRADRAKDSGRMFAAGAEEVYYVQTRTKYTREVGHILACILDPSLPVVIESGGLIETIRPGMALLLTREAPTIVQQRKYSMGNETRSGLSSKGGRCTSGSDVIKSVNDAWKYPKADLEAGSEFTQVIDIEKKSPGWMDRIGFRNGKWEITTT